MADETKTERDPFLGRNFDGYRVDEVIGRGGMGVVYKATQLSLSRPVAIKILPEDVSEHPQFVERFHREVDILSRLAHPNIVTVFERGEVDGRLYLAMECIEGTSLREVMKAGPLPPHEALILVRSVLSALEHAHDRGIIHRDIKPENVLVAPGGIVKVADFGLSRLLDPGDETRLTHTHLALGTFEYMSPEQRERAKEADERSDLYATGVVLYEMIAGELPIGRFDPLSKKAECDSRIDDVVERSLNKSPDERFQRASEMGEAVSSLLTPAPVVGQAAPPPLPSPPPAATGSRYRYVASVAAAALMLVILAMVASGTGNWGLIGILAGVGVAIATGFVVNALMRPRRPRPAVPRAPSRPEDKPIRSIISWLLIMMAPVFCFFVISGFWLMFSSFQEDGDAAGRQTRVDALEAAASAAMSQPHGVVAKWVGEKPPGFVEALSSDPMAIQWVARVLDVELVQVAQYRLVSWSDQILLLVPKKGDPLNAKAQVAFSWLVQQAAPQVDAHAAPTKVFTGFEDAAFLKKLSATPVPDGLVKKWRTEWLDEE